jgi:mannitol/fructose-specific phosphotransferase system IIA component (Ntr-type)
VTWRVFRSDRLATASIVAILLTSGLADYVGVSSLLACLFLGLTLANVRPDRDEIGHRVFVDFESAILAVFFTLAGMDLHLEYVVPGGLVALVVIAARFVGKVAAGRLSMWAAGATDAVRRYLGVALIPQAGVAVGLMILVQEDPALTAIAQLFLAVGLTSVTANEIVGPILTRMGLAASRDAGKDRPRLIDFIHEENIVTDFRAASKTEAIEKLTDLLLRTHGVTMEREQLLASVLKREREASTCIGQGLAIPHGALDEGDNIAGVMALSRHGLEFDTPDGKPVHCMVLLATPEDQRDRHLEVLGVLARVIGSDRIIRQELFGAESAAHAFDILHAEEQEFNPFLEEAT